MAIGEGGGNRVGERGNFKGRAKCTGELGEDTSHIARSVSQSSNVLEKKKHISADLKECVKL